VATDPKRVRLQVDPDARLAAAVGGAVRFLAESAGMPEEVCREFQEATVRACVATFESHCDATHLVELLRFDDRLEVIVGGEAGTSAVRLSRSVVPQP
jgi:hypothetical protein